MTEPTVGSMLGRYRLDREVGRGGMGMVFHAHDELLHRSVAVKVLATGLADDKEFRLRFLREMRLAGALEHPNVVPVYDAGEVGRHLYLATRYVEGEDLRAAIHRHAKLAPERVATIALQLAAGLDAAHKRGLVHRDIKPANVLLETSPEGEDHVYLTDFGLAREAASDTGLTNTGQWMGTIDYAPPEQFESGGVVSARSDIYSMGCLLFEALTGHVPYQGGLGRKVAGHTTEPLPSVGSGLHEHDAIDAVLARATAKHPEDRHLSAGDLGRALAAAIRSQPVATAERTVATGTALTGLLTNDGAEHAETAPMGRRRTPRPPHVAPAPPPVTPPLAPTPPSQTSRRGAALVAAAVLGAAAMLGAAVVITGVLVLPVDRDDADTATARTTSAGMSTVEHVSTVDHVTTVTVTKPEAVAAPSPSSFIAGDYVQLGSFRRRSAAETLARRMASKAGIDAQVIASDDAAELVPGFFVVLAGPVDAAEGRRLAHAARDGGVQDGFVRALRPDSATAAPADLAGSAFSADLRQVSAKTPSLNKHIPTTLTFSGGGRGGNVAYGVPLCSGTLTFLDANGPVLRYREHITSGTCTDDGTWTLRRHNGRLGGAWSHTDREYFVSGWLR
jgi:hypothetical protein